MAAVALGIGLASVLSGCGAFGQWGLRESAPDAKISDEVRELFAQSPELGSPNSISIQTHRAVVYLRGLVSTPYQVAEAGSIAGRAAGVNSVQNLLSVDNSR
jgi:osmotically-inducible protein OsmY